MSSTLRGYIMTKARDIADGQSVDTTNFVTKSNGVIEALDGSNLTGVGGGKFKQVVQATSAGETNIATQTYTEVLNKDITPVGSGNQILVIVSLAGVGHHSGANGGAIRLLKEGSELTVLTPYASDDGDTTKNFYGSNETFFYLDDNSAAGVATNYSVEVKNASATGAFRINANSNCHSSLTLMEIEP
jgi:hypothetical protein